MNLDHTYGCCGVHCAACPDYTAKNCRCRSGAPCNAVDCTRRHGVDFCGDCPEFPCEDIRAFYAESESHAAAFAAMQALHEKRQ